MSVLRGTKKKRTAFVKLHEFYVAQNMHNGIVYGQPRTGKTVFVVDMLDDFKGMNFTCFINDVAKGFDIKTKQPRSEILLFFSKDLKHIKDVRVFVPPGCKVDIEDTTFELIEIDSYGKLFENLKPDKLNVLCFETFILHPLALARFWALFAIELLFRSKSYSLNLPIFGVIDQINHVFPSRAMKMAGQAGKLQDTASNWFARFLMDSSGSGIKIVGTSHGITQVKKSIRTSFQWKFFKTFTDDVSVAVKRISPAQGVIQTLDLNCVYATNDQNWGDVFEGIPNITYASKAVHYRGNRIIDRHWMLHSDYQELVMTQAEIQKLEGNSSPDVIKWELGSLYLAGYTCKSIARIYNISVGTVNAYLEYCRQYPHYCRLERILRPNGRSRYPPSEEEKTLYIPPDAEMVGLTFGGGGGR